ncbi:MAG: PD40 domain-containing protein, partial [Phycisphaerae bacterium]|nr:PD40 domain-containing protein [Phycisphaerae bacterium]
MPRGALHAQSTRLLRQPTLSDKHVAFAHGGDLWIVDRAGGEARRLTSTPAVESDPHFSPDGAWIAFTSNRSDNEAVYVLPVVGGTPTRLTWYPADASAKGWTPDGKRILYASSRQTAPVGFDRLWTVSVEGGPSELLAAPWGHDGSFSPSGARLVVDRVSRWDSEWRHYRGGQNTPLTILDLHSLEEIRLPNERTTDIHPLWIGQTIYFLSDRDWIMNIWSYDVESGQLTQVTDFTDVDVKWLSGHDNTLIFERDGYIHTLDLANGEIRRLKITVRGDFPWAEPRWEEVSGRIQSAALSPTGKRAVFEARGEIFTVPAEKGSPRNLTRSSGAADRAPVWSPQGDEIAWFSDSGDGYELLIADQNGLSDPRRMAIGESKMAWEPTWSPDGKSTAFVDDDVRIRVLNVESGNIITADTGGANIERGDTGLTWSSDSRWLAYAKTFPNNLRRIVVWSADDGDARAVTDPMADAMSPSWDRDGKHL